MPVCLAVLLSMTTGGRGRGEGVPHCFLRMRHPASAQGGSGVLDWPSSITEAHPPSPTKPLPQGRPPPPYPRPCHRDTWRGRAGTYSGSRGACGACLAIFAGKTLEKREKSDVAACSSSVLRNPRTVEVHSVAQSFRTFTIPGLNSRCTPSLPCLPRPLLLPQSFSAQGSSLSPWAADSRQSKVPLCGLPKVPKQLASATESHAATGAPQEASHRNASPLWVSSQRQDRQWGTYSQTRSARKSFLTSFARFALGEKVQGHEVKGLVGVGSRAGWGDWGVGSDRQRRLKLSISIFSYAQRYELRVLPHGTMSWLRGPKALRSPGFPQSHALLQDTEA